MGFGTSSAYPRSRIPLPPQKRTTFMKSPILFRVVLLVDRNSWNGHHKPTSPFPNVVQLPHDFVLQVPRQDDDVVRFSFADPVRVINRYAAARQESALLVGTSIDGVLNEVFADTAVVEQRRTLSGRTVSCHRLAVLRGLKQKVE